MSERLAQGNLGLKFLKCCLCGKNADYYNYKVANWVCLLCKPFPKKEEKNENRQNE